MRKGSRTALKTKRAQLVEFLRASRKGWRENFADPKKYPPLYNDTWFKGLGSTIEAEVYFNTMQLALMENPKGFFCNERGRHEAKPRCSCYTGHQRQREYVRYVLIAEI
jgi:hypothetical protein